MKYLTELGKKDFEEVWEIMRESFPINERRTREGQEQLLAEPYYRLYGYRQDGVLAGFIAVWELEEFTFGEHFAVNKNYRNSGLGAKMLQELLNASARPFILEVELPEEELPRRRIGFYERNGFVLNPFDYTQPALSAEGEPIPLRIMSRPKALSCQEFLKVKDVLYKYVYKIEKE